MKEETIKFKFTETEARVILSLLDYCRSGDESASNFRAALYSLQNKFEPYRTEYEDTERISFTRENQLGVQKIYNSKSKSFITIEID